MSRLIIKKHRKTLTFEAITDARRKAGYLSMDDNVMDVYGDYANRKIVIEIEMRKLKVHTVI